MKIALQINGREMTFSEEELTAILEKHFSEETAETAKTKAGVELAKAEATELEVVRVPTEGKCFEVNPMGIDRSLFQKERSDSQQERTRKRILEAFAEADKHPKKYAKPFKTLIPEKTWDGYKTVRELKQYAKELGGHHGNKTEQALEWAQRLSNGETWEAICNDRDTAKWYRLVDWENGYARLVGGSRILFDNYPASGVGSDNFNDFNEIINTVPFVVL